MIWYLKKVKNCFRILSKTELLSLLEDNTFTDFDKMVMKCLVQDMTTQNIIIQLGCTKEELYKSYEKIASKI